MPRTTKQHKQQVINECNDIDNKLCITNSLAIGEVKAKTETNTDRISDLDDKFTNLLNVINRNHVESLTQDQKLTANLAAITTVLQQQNTLQQQLITDNKEIKENVSNIEKKMINVEGDIKALKTDSANMKKNHADWETKVNKLEKISIFIYALGVVIAGIAMIIIYWGDISKVLFPDKTTGDIKQVIQQEVVVPNTKVQIIDDKKK